MNVQVPFGALSEFAPDEHAPDGGNQRRALAQSVGDGRPGDSGGDHIQAEREHPDASAQESERMQPGASAEVVGVGDLARAHEDRIHHDVAREQAHREQDQRGVRRQQSRLNRARGEIRRHGSQQLRIEESHQTTRHHGERQSPQWFGLRGLSQTAVRESRHDHGEDDQRHARQSAGARLPLGART